MPQAVHTLLRARDGHHRLLGSLAAGALLIAASSAACHQPAAEESTDQNQYEQLVARFENGEPDIDLVDLRLAFAHSPHAVAARDESRRALSQIAALLADQEYERALALAEGLLPRNFVDIELHTAAALAHEALGDRTRADHHRRLADGLLRSICPGTDGRSPEAPCTVFSIAEQYGYLRARGLAKILQGVGRCADGARCDMLRVRDRQSGEEFNLYFELGRWESQALVKESLRSRSGVRAGDGHGGPPRD